jgi:hypothetical protein
MAVHSAEAPRLPVAVPSLVAAVRSVTTRPLAAAVRSVRAARSVTARPLVVVPRPAEAVHPAAKPHHSATAPHLAVAGHLVEVAHPVAEPPLVAASSPAALAGQASPVTISDAVLTRAMTGPAGHTPATTSDVAPTPATTSPAGLMHAVVNPGTLRIAVVSPEVRTDVTASPGVRTGAPGTPIPGRGRRPLERIAPAVATRATRVLASLVVGKGHVQTGHPADRCVAVRLEMPSPGTNGPVSAGLASAVSGRAATSVAALGSTVRDPAGAGTNAARRARMSHPMNSRGACSPRYLRISMTR